MDAPMLLIDGDWLAFSTAIAFQKKNPFDEEAEPMYDGKMALATLEHRIAKVMGIFDSPNIEFHFSCKREDNWRRVILPDYKMNRKGKLTPIGLPSLVSHCKRSYPSVDVPTLEADDTLGIAATGKYKGNNIIVSVDKDFLTVPTRIWNPVKEIHKKQNKMGAFKAFIYQTIIGDSSDGFKGIKGCGPKAAVKLITANSKKLHNIWEPLVALATKKKMSEEDLLTQARMAHILQDGDYDEDTKEVRLWTPDMIKEML